MNKSPPMNAQQQLPPQSSKKQKKKNKKRKRRQSKKKKQQQTEKKAVSPPDSAKLSGSISSNFESTPDVTDCFVLNGSAPHSNGKEKEAETAIESVSYFG